MITQNQFIYYYDHKRKFVLYVNYVQYFCIVLSTHPYNLWYVEETVYNNSCTRRLVVFSLPYCFTSERTSIYNNVTSINYWIDSSLNFDIKYYYQFISYVITIIRCRSYFLSAFPEFWLFCSHIYRSWWWYSVSITTIFIKVWN